MSLLTHSLNISCDSWHGRWYHHWLSLGGKAPGTENLCHYVRVLLFWAPLKWFFKGRIKQVAPPWAVGLGLVVAGLIGLAFYLWPDVALKVLMWTSIVSAIVGLGISAVFIHDRGSRRTQKLFVRATSLIWIAPYLLYRAGRWIWEKYERQLTSAAEWVLDPKYTRLQFSPLVVAIIVFAVGWAVLDFWDFLSFIGIIAAVAAVLCLCVGIISVIEWVKERRWRRRLSSESRAASRSVLGRFYESTVDTVKLGVTYAATKKRGSKICPFIRFKDPDTA